MTDQPKPTTPWCDFCQEAMQPTAGLEVLAMFTGAKHPAQGASEHFPWCCPKCGTLRSYETRYRWTDETRTRFEPVES